MSSSSSSSSTTSSTFPGLRWGIVSTASIGSKDARAIKRAGGVVLALSSRTLTDSVHSICSSRGISRALAPYDALFDQTDIDAVYLPTPTSMHKDGTIKAANKGKHVVCEKPAACNTRELVEMLESCKQNKVYFIDGLMFDHHPRQRVLRALLSSASSPLPSSSLQSSPGPLGAITHVSTHFSFYTDPSKQPRNIRLQSELEPLGALGDLAWYNVRFVLFAFAYELPVAVSCSIRYEFGVPMSCTGMLHFGTDGKRTATFFASFEAQFQQTCCIACEHGSISLSDFVIPDAAHSASFRINRSHGIDLDTEKNDTSHDTNITVTMRHEQETYLFMKAQQRIHEIKTTGKVDPTKPEMPPAATVKKMLVYGDVTIDADADGYTTLLDEADARLKVLWTQSILDACIASAKQDGAKVSMAYAQFEP